MANSKRLIDDVDVENNTDKAYVDENGIAECYVDVNNDTDRIDLRENGSINSYIFDSFDDVSTLKVKIKINGCVRFIIAEGFKNLDFLIEFTNPLDRVFFILSDSVTIVHINNSELFYFDEKKKCVYKNLDEIKYFFLMSKNCNYLATFKMLNILPEMKNTIFFTEVLNNDNFTCTFDENEMPVFHITSKTQDYYFHGWKSLPYFRTVTLVHFLINNIPFTNYLLKNVNHVKDIKCYLKSVEFDQLPLDLDLDDVLNKFKPSYNLTCGKDVTNINFAYKESLQIYGKYNILNPSCKYYTDKTHTLLCKNNKAVIASKSFKPYKKIHDKLYSYKFEDKINKIEAGCFMDLKSEYFFINKPINLIESGAFRHCNIKYLIIDNNKCNIEHGAFYTYPYKKISETLVIPYHINEKLISDKYDYYVCDVKNIFNLFKKKIKLFPKCKKEYERLIENEDVMTKLFKFYSHNVEFVKDLVDNLKLSSKARECIITVSNKVGDFNLVNDIMTRKNIDDDLDGDLNF